MTTPQTHEPCSPGCPGWIVDAEGGDIQRCDDCARFADDDAAAACVRDSERSFDAKIEAFARLLESEQIDSARRKYPGLDAANGCKVSVRPGKKYVKVDVGTSGKYMVEVSTEKIYGIKGYGVIHRGHQYGTLETIAEWNWGSYRAVRRNP